jgi:hypothetical protein
MWFAAATLAAARASTHLGRQLAEERLLARLLADWGVSKPASRDDLVRIKRELGRRISFDLADRDTRRPLLRASALDTWRSGIGFCGENSRVAVLLLNRSGIRANRIYLQGTRWGHVAVEHRWEGAWRFFDAHNDPETQLPDDFVAMIGSDVIGLFPNGHKEWNPWQRAARARMAFRLPVRWFDGIRPPRWLVALCERPHSILAVVWGVTAAGCVAVFVREVSP